MSEAGRASDVQHLRYRLAGRKEIYDVNRNKVIATFADAEDCDRYLDWLREREKDLVLIRAFQTW